MTGKKQKKQVKSKVLRHLRPKRRKMEEPLLGKINTLTKKNNLFSVVKNNMHKIRGLHRVKNKNLIQNDFWVSVGPGLKKRV